jgi:hypothetical protein
MFLKCFQNRNGPMSYWAGPFHRQHSKRGTRRLVADAKSVDSPRCGYIIERVDLLGLRRCSSIWMSKEKRWLAFHFPRVLLGCVRFLDRSIPFHCHGTVLSLCSVWTKNYHETVLSLCSILE